MDDDQWGDPHEMDDEMEEYRMDAAYDAAVEKFPPWVLNIRVELNICSGIYAEHIIKEYDQDGVSHEIVDDIDGGDFYLCSAESFQGG